MQSDPGLKAPGLKAPGLKAPGFQSLIAKRIHSAFSLNPLVCPSKAPGFQSLIAKRIHSAFSLNHPVVCLSLWCHYSEAKRESVLEKLR